MTHRSSEYVVLVVDDEARDQKLMSTILRASGYGVLTATNGEEALDVVGREKVDAILLDVAMPGVDGIEVTRQLKADERLRSIPIIVTTALQDRDVQLRALDAGAEDFLVKPVHRLELNTRLRNLLRLKSISDQLAHHDRDQLALVEPKIAEIVANEAKYRTLVETAPDVIMIATADGTIEFINRTLDTLSMDQVVGSSVYDYVDAECAETTKAAFDRALAGTEFVDFTVEAPGDEGSVRHYSNRVRRLPEAAGERRVLIFSTDSTDTKDAQRALADVQSHLHQAQKLESLGELAGGIAHDFNNLLTAIISFTRFVLDDLPIADPRRSDLSEVLRAADSAGHLTNQLLSFSRRRPIEPSLINVNMALNGIVKVLRRTLGERVELALVPAPRPIHILFDPGQFDQLIMNLAINARDAMPDGGALTITVASRQSEMSSTGGYAEIKVRDAGSGMSKDTLERAFEPFFSTKGERGTGLGLATCYGIAKQAHGDISIKSTLGEGTEFTLLLPSTEDARDRIPATEVIRQHAQRIRGRALVVDDQPAILNIMSRALEEVGLVVTKAHSAEEALSVLDDEQELDLLVTDVMLPRLSGVELANRLRKTRPNLLVLMCSGYMGEETQPILGAEELTSALSKPFSAEELMARVEQLLIQRERKTRAIFHILLVQDNTEAENMLRGLLAEHRVANELHTARGYDMVLDNLLGADAASVVLLDLELPEAHAVLDATRSNEQTRDLPVVLLVPSGDKAPAALLSSSPATCYVHKPVDFEELSAALGELGLSWQV